MIYNQWSGGAGTSDWNTAANWDLARVPTTSDKAGVKTVGGPLVDSSTPPCGEWTLGGVSGGVITINSGGTVQTFVGDGTGRVSMAQSADENGTLNMNGGTATFGGILDVGYAGTGHINLDGGTISAADFAMRRSGGVGTMDITGGTLIIDGDKTSLINGYISNGWITAHDGLGTVNVNYNVPNPNKTTVTGYLATPQATNPSPNSGATNVPIDANLSWTAGDDAVSHDVYFGTTSPGAFQQNQTETTFNPGTLTPSTIYYWRIDEVTESLGTITGTVWNFTTAQLKASDPSPTDGVTDMPLNTTLSWTAGAGAVSHDVYFGTTSPGTFQGNQATTNFDPGILAATTTYYWRIDEKNGGTVTGDVWSFTTGTPPEVHPYLSWRNDPTNSIVVNWWNPIATGDSSVDYGLTSSYGSTEDVATATNFHHVELTSLTPATTYHYRIRSSDGTAGSDNTFTTSDVNVTSFSFAVFGDVRGVALPADSTMYHTRHKELCDWMTAQNFPFVLQTGDTVWEGSILTTDPQTKVEVESYFIEFFRAEQNLSKSRVIMATMGNHEVQPGGRDYTYYYDMYEGAFPTNGTTDNRGRVYSFDYGNAHFVCLSSYQINITSLQKDWLEADLITARDNPDIKWIFAFMHAPMYTTSGHPGRVDELAAWGPLFDKYHVDIVFAGHNHVYERSYSIKADEVVDDYEGTVYITSGLGGAPFGNVSEDPKFAYGCGAADPDFKGTLAVCITINGSHLTAQAIPNQTGVPVDSFELMPPFLNGDFDQSGTVDINDLDIFTGSWLDTGMWP